MIGGIAVVKPTFKDAQTVDQSARSGAEIGFTRRKLETVDRRLQERFIDAVGDQFFERRHGELVKFIGARGFRAVDLNAERRLQIIFVETRIDVLADVRIDERLPQRSGGRDQ